MNARVRYRAQDCGKLVVHLVDVETEDGNTEGREVGVALPVVAAACVVDSAVDLDCQQEFRAVEVDDVASDDVLTTKSETKPSSTKSLPQPSLRWSRLPPHRPGQRELVACCRPRRARQRLFEVAASHVLPSTRQSQSCALLSPPLPPWRGKGPGDGGSRKPRGREM